MPFVNAQQVLLKELSENTFVHTSYLQTDDYGHVPCNGLVVRNGQQALIFDTPTDDQSAKELIRLVQDSLHCKIMTVVPTHFHSDCLGGLRAFHEAGIPSIANELTLDLAKNSGVEIPKNGFRDSLTLEIGPGLSLEQAAAIQATQVAAKPPDNLCKNSSRFMFILVAIFQAINQINLVLFCE